MLFAFALTVMLIITLVLGYIVVTNPDALFGGAASTEVIQEIQDLQVETGPSAEEMTDNFAYNMSLFNEDFTKELLAEQELEVAFIPSRNTYIEFKVGENNDAQYIPGPEYDVIVVQGGHFEFSTTLLYEDKLTEGKMKAFVNKLSYRINLVSEAMNTVQGLVEEGTVSDKIIRHVVSDEEVGLMHFVTDCSEGGSCQFELNAKSGSITIMSP